MLVQKLPLPVRWFTFQPFDDAPGLLNPLWVSFNNAIAGNVANRELFASVFEENRCLFFGLMSYVHCSLNLVFAVKMALELMAVCAKPAGVSENARDSLLDQPGWLFLFFAVLEGGAAMFRCDWWALWQSAMKNNV